jgi:hypothetical protein
MDIWYVYEMRSVLSPTGKPYIGSSKDFYGRKYYHKFKFKLNHIPELIPIAGPYYTRKEARRAEQPFRVENGWPHENEACIKGGKNSNGGKINVENGSGFCNFEARSKAGKGKIWINNGIKNKLIYPKEFDQWFSKGYNKGMLKSTSD